MAPLIKVSRGAERRAGPWRAEVEKVKCGGGMRGRGAREREGEIEGGRVRRGGARNVREGAKEDE